MARTVQQWYDFIIAEKESMASLNGLQPNMDSAQTLLANLTTTSKVAIWRLWAFVQAVAAWTLESIMELRKAEIQAISDATEPQTDRWYKKKLHQFQYPSAYTMVNNVPAFSPVDENLQIIKYAAVASGTNNDMAVKVAIDVGGNPAPLTTAQYNAVVAYMDAIKAPGTAVTVLSLNADKVKLQYDYYYDPIRTTPAQIKTDVEAAINDYRKDLQRTNFNGVVNLMAIEDAMQQVAGYKRMRRIGAAYKIGAGAYTAFDVDYQTVAGYFIISPDAGETLADTINYIAQP